MSHPLFAPAARRRRRWGRTFLMLLVASVCLLAGAAGGALWYVSQDMPDLEALQGYQPSQVSRVYGDDRQVVGQFYVERRILTPLSDIPQHLVNAVIAVEDARFFEHPGLDVVGIARAVWTNLRRGGKVEGASTITQQLARSLFLSSERTYTRKIKELVLAYKMELVLTKEQILELYLNQIYFGQGAYGVGAAAQTYFAKDLKALTVAEAAVLAGLPKSPNNFSPFKNPDRVKRRQEHVLSRMQDAGFLTAEERDQAAAEPLAYKRPVTEQIGPHFIEYVRQHLVARHGETMVYKGGLNIYTTLNVPMQKAAERAVGDGLRALDKRQGWRGLIGHQEPPAPPEKEGNKGGDKPGSDPPPAWHEGDLLQGVVTKVGKEHVLVQVGAATGKLAFDDMAWARRRLKGKDPTKDYAVAPNVKQLLKPGDVIEVAVKKVDKDGVAFRLEQTPVVEGALVAIDPRTGAVRALVGGLDFAKSEYNRAVSAHRQSGSAFKPVIYATAMNEGLSPGTVVVDTPVVYEQEDPEKTWKPENYEKKFYGPISLREALAHSRNLATVRLLERIGVKKVIDFAKSLGITSPLNADLSLALGSSSVTLMELTSAFGTFANQGTRLEPYLIGRVESPDGGELEQTLFEPKPVVSKETAYLITNMMEDVVQRGTAQAAKVIEQPIAGKTGTTNDYTDAWFIGFTPNLVVGVWVGFDDIRPLGESESGAHAALPIWIQFMQAVLPTLPVESFEIPDEIQFVRVDPKTGMLPHGPEGQGTVEIFAKGTEPTDSAPIRLDPADFYRLDQLPDGAL